MTGSSESDLKVCENTSATSDNFGSEKTKKKKISTFSVKNTFFERFSLGYPQRKCWVTDSCLYPIYGSLSRLELSIWESQFTQEGIQSSLIASPALGMDLTLFPAGLSSVHTPPAPTQPASITAHAAVRLHNRGATPTTRKTLLGQGREKEIN